MYRGGSILTHNEDVSIIGAYNGHSILILGIEAQFTAIFVSWMANFSETALNEEDKTGKMLKNKT